MEVTPYDICTICGRRIRFWHAWIATLWDQIRLNGTRPLVLGRAHVRCYDRQIFDSVRALINDDSTTPPPQMTWHKAPK